ncbi:carboxymuconolactone decarboxylase family protein [Marilutibacter maris]|uniref:Alkylhydroperoxidase n=1 Tax=Marilutibacter maris TaxID=1605891 RepID=A0A2U9T7C4_9GAMM|nr:carboxymuconolactone decarboxylase family protein [Lysobacter maris]AWV07442.1 alkylhydroperoxidase [Lysobacter maris]KAB8198532.1 carboxymuconolactone decarboxylase family protein [Lysobacter maris]
MNASHIDYSTLAPRPFQLLAQLSGQLYKGPLGGQLVELVSLRISQLNGCVFCLDMHAEALRRAGVAQRKLDTVAAWRESPLFDARERAALDWAEALNALGHAPVPDDALEALREQFDEREISELSFAVAAIRAWNVLNVGLRKPLPETPYVAAAA